MATIGNGHAGIFVLCALALMGSQNHVAVGIEWLLVSIAAGTVYVYGYLRARSKGGSPTTLSLLRTMTGTMLYVALIVGSVVLASNSTAGLYIAAVAMVSIGVYSVSGAWLLVVAAYEDK
jgi:hypothetical protein